MSKFYGPCFVVRLWGKDVTVHIHGQCSCLPKGEWVDLGDGHLKLVRQ